MNASDIKAFNFLTIWGYELWQMCSEALYYHVDHVNDDMIHVNCIGVLAPKLCTTNFSTNNGMHCKCRHKVAPHTIQCPHETALAFGEFLPHV